MPQIIIMYGPPASGKSFIRNRIVSRLNLKDYTYLNIDDMVEEITEYKEDIKRCKEEFKKYNYINNIPPSLEEICTKIYFKYRLQIEPIFNKMLDNALKDERDIIIEMTGNNVSWFTSEYDNIYLNNHKIYEFILVYIIAPNELIFKRILERAKIIGRYPSKKSVENTIMNAQTNFKNILPFMSKVFVLDENGNEILYVKKICNVDKEFLRNKTDSFVNTVKLLCGGNFNNYKNIILAMLATTAILIILIIIFYYIYRRFIYIKCVTQAPRY